MKTFYITLDDIGTKLHEGANIKAEKFTSFSDFENFFKSYYADRCGLSTHDIEIITAEEGDCWLKVASFDNIEKSVHPLTMDQITVRHPGQHPGGQMYWVSPNVPVYIVNFK